MDLSRESYFIVGNDSVNYLEDPGDKIQLEERVRKVKGIVEVKSLI